MKSQTILNKQLTANFLKNGGSASHDDTLELGFQGNFPKAGLPLQGY